jgi:eukaryotic-like serine/threonine-protein kinase
LNVEILSIKGSGYFCDVLKAKNESKVTLAVKQLKKGFVDNEAYVHRFKREVAILKELEECPYIIPCLDFELDDEKLIYRYSMPMADYNLYRYIRTYNNQINLDERIRIFDQILKGVLYAHSKGIIHRDIAPNNVLLFEEDEDITVMISDFGLGKDYKSLSNFTKSVGKYGQQLYVAPEQFNNLKNATAQSDIFALGKLLYFVLTGKDPLTISSTAKFHSLIVKAVQDEPMDRHQDIDEFIQQYERLKNLYLQPQKATNYESMAEYLKNNTDKFKWEFFHHLALEANVIDHVFDDYLNPIVDLFNIEGKLKAYIDFANEGIMDFLEVFTKNLHDCYHRTGWPFSYLDSFGRFFNYLYNIVPQADAKLICLKELWNISFEQDQWGPQKMMENLIRGKINYESIEPFAEFLTESKSPYAYRILEKGRLSEINPIIRTSLINLVERVDEDTKHKKDHDWDDF